MRRNRQALSRLETLWKQLVHDQPFTYTFLDERIARLYKKDQQLSWLVRISTVVTIFVSCIGLLGLIFFTVERKKKEISIRKVLGARVADIVFLLNKEFMVLVGNRLRYLIPNCFPGYASMAAELCLSHCHLLVDLRAGRTDRPYDQPLTISLRVIRAALINPTDNLRSE